ncbi:Glyoxalase/bleomycin resistance protein/dioxygenase domain protein [Candidatus Omnitrophus magneticus]|uniref:Glyoxalase/bleomycin resistance protein/dioxygenase domain protein n=1 Tax=Candidatus Omnitrophus magneticus TaxID=1609969 RepID=A0A0F0CQY9_9BACT|nr:Glyoxalase/bleomycin resistance protein/dioxygenase domain protein [Candidatus Omnitrophus magneticus]
MDANPMNELHFWEDRTMALKFKKLTPDLMVTDVAITVKFYIEKLGFRLNMLVPENENTIETNLIDGKKYVYAMVSRDEVFLMFMRKDVYEKDVPSLKDVPIGASATFYCDVDNIDMLFNLFKESGVDIIKNVSMTWYGMKEFYIKDCNGYILGFAEQVKQP